MTDRVCDTIDASAVTRKALPIRTIAGSIAASIAFVMELTLVPLVLPALQAYHDLTIGDLAWVFNSYGIAVALGVILGGWIGDGFGIRKVFTAGVLMFAAGALLVACAGSFETLIAGRILQGFGGGIFSPLVPLLLTRALPKRPGKILIIWGSVIGYVAAFAPLIVGQVIGYTGWEAVFGLFAVLSAVALLLSVKPDATRSEPTSRKLPNPRRLLEAPNLWLVYGYIFCTYGALTFYLFRLPLLLADMGYDVTTIGLILAMMWLSFSVTSTLLRNLVDGTHVRSIILAAPVLIAAGFGLATIAAGGVWILASAALIGAGFACSNAPSTQLVLKFAPNGLSALATSLDITFARLGGVASVAILAQVDFGYSVLVVAGLSLAALVCVMAPLRKLLMTQERS